MTDPLSDWVERLAVLTAAQDTWHKLTLPDHAVPARVREALDNSNISRYIWDTSDLINDTYWNDPVKEWSEAKQIFFEDANDLVMFRLLL